MENDDPLVKGDYTRSADELVFSSNIFAGCIIIGLVIVAIGLITG